jgi:hypothetical protein
LSYNGGVQFGLVTDKTFVSDPAQIVERFFPEFEMLLLTVLQCPRGIPLDPGAAERRIFARGEMGARSAARRRPDRAV